jgi:hypothetical protein
MNASFSTDLLQTLAGTTAWTMRLFTLFSRGHGSRGPREPDAQEGPLACLLRF